jgi:ParB family chromosome partitioning protein
MSTEAANQEYQTVNLSQLIPSKTNPRKTFDAAALKELAESIRAVGLLQPILARPTTTEHIFEIVAGERRWRAAQIAEQITVPIRVRELTEAQVIEAQVIENLIRADVHPYEETQGFLALMNLDPARYTAQELAAKTGKSVTFVVQRLKLADLIPAAAEEFQKDHINTGHALQLARLSPAQQEEALPHCFEQVWFDGKQRKRLVTVVQFANYIEKNITLELSEAPFNREDATLYPEAGACLNCPKRSGFNTLLFPDVKKDSCFDGACYGEKINRFITVSNLVQLAGDYRPVPDDSQALPRRQYTILKDADECEYATKGIVSIGYNSGSILTVCTAVECQKHPKLNSAPESAEESAADLEANRQYRIENRIKEETAAQLRKDFTKKVAAVPTADEMELLAIMVAHAAAECAPELLATWGALPTDQEADTMTYEETLDYLLNYVAGLSGKQRTAAIFEMLLCSVGDCDPHNYRESATVAKAAKIYHISIPSVEKRIRRKVEAEIEIEDAQELEEAATAAAEAQEQPTEATDEPAEANGSQQPAPAPEDAQGDDEQQPRTTRHPRQRSPAARQGREAATPPPPSE